MKLTKEIFVGQTWQRKSDLSVIKVMAVKDNYAMVRIKGCIPYVISFKELSSKYYRGYKNNEIWK